MTIPFFILGGPPGAGKSTIGPGVAEKLDFPFFEGASLVSDEAKAAMSKGVPLSESAHTQWMDDIVNAAYRMEQDSSPKGMVTTCTALTRRVRDRLRKRVHELNERGSKLELVIIWCNIDKEVSFRRAKKREGHYYNPDMTEWLFSRTQVPCVEGDEKEENTYLVDATQNVENVTGEVLKIMEANIK
jgi:gluconokinase